METFAKLFERFLVFVYHCFDRIVIQGYLPLQQFRGDLSGQQRNSLLTASMAGNGSGKIGQDVEALKIAGFSDGQ